MKRWIIIISIFLGSFLLLCLMCSCDSPLSCTKANLSCDNNQNKIAICGKQQCGFRCEGSDSTCEWFPLWFGAENRGCFLQPIICGFGLCTLGPIDSNGTAESEVPERNNQITLRKETSPVTSDDYLVKKVTYKLYDPSNGVYEISEDFSEILESDVFADLREKSYQFWNQEQLYDLKFSIFVVIDIDAYTEMTLEASIPFITELYSDDITNQSPSAKTYSQQKTINGENQSIEIKIEDIDLIYAQRTWELRLGKLSFTGTKEYYTREGS